MIVGLSRTVGSRNLLANSSRILSTPSIIYRGYANTNTPATPPRKKRSATPQVDIAKIPINELTVLSNYYIPPPFTKCPISSWPKLAIRRMGAIAGITYSVFKFRTELKKKIQFNLWKDIAIEQYVKTNKVFTAACNKRAVERDLYLMNQLKNVAVKEVINGLMERAETFPMNAKISWELVSIVGNPKIVAFIAIPDINEITTYVQFVMKLTTNQKYEVTVDGKVTNDEKVVTDYLAFTLNPFTEELLLTGKLFESDHIRGVMDDTVLAGNISLFKAFSKSVSDIYRSDPNLKK
ncbi:mitochondrial inner membrane protein Mba1 [Scheffersomyces coipomensis]|uniref:mitochondrial inner membrane protein Mba1 n=1 Tax=Scheffersomyces coipomensis TaxID=1788519 RepID=UPI00315D8FD2